MTLEGRNIYSGEDGTRRKVYVRMDQKLVSTYGQRERSSVLLRRRREFPLDGYKSSGTFILSVLKRSEYADSKGQVFALISRGTEYSFIQNHENEYEIRFRQPYRICG